VTDFYDMIEEPVRDLVRLLRDNGYNTEDSCGHEGYIQIGYVLDGNSLQELHRLIWTHLHERGEPVSFDITMEHFVRDGHMAGTLLNVWLLPSGLAGSRPWPKELVERRERFKKLRAEEIKIRRGLHDKVSQRVHEARMKVGFIQEAPE